MRIGCLQFAPQVGDVNNNLNRADAVLNRAEPEDLDLLVLPEMAFSGYNFKSLSEIAPFLEYSGSGISSLWARTIALKYDCTVIVGYPEKVDPRLRWPTGPEYYNSAIVVNDDGETVANYRKTHLYMTDEKWALENPAGFYNGVLVGLGRTAIGICMDLNPYRFEAPWHAFEFAFHILSMDANLVVLTMAWMTREDGRMFSRMPQEPDMDTLAYWLTRLEPVIRADNEDEIIVVFANRTGTEDEAVYAGTSAVLGIKNGEVCVYGILGRGDKELLVVDTDQAPYAILTHGPDGNIVPADGAPSLHRSPVEPKKPPFDQQEGNGRASEGRETTTSGSSSGEANSTGSTRRSPKASDTTSSRRKGQKKLTVNTNSDALRHRKSNSPTVQTPTCPSPTPVSLRPQVSMPPAASLTMKYIDSYVPPSHGQGLQSEHGGFQGVRKTDSLPDPFVKYQSHRNDEAEVPVFLDNSPPVSPEKSMSHFSDSSPASPQLFWIPSRDMIRSSGEHRSWLPARSDGTAFSEAGSALSAPNTNITNPNTATVIRQRQNSRQERPASRTKKRSTEVGTATRRASESLLDKQTSTAGSKHQLDRPASPKSRNASRSRGPEQPGSAIEPGEDLQEISRQLGEIAKRVSSASRRETPSRGTGRLPIGAPNLTLLEELRDQRNGSSQQQSIPIAACIDLWEAEHGSPPHSGLMEDELLHRVPSSSVQERRDPPATNSLRGRDADRPPSRAHNWSQRPSSRSNRTVSRGRQPLMTNQSTPSHEDRRAGRGQGTRSRPSGSTEPVDLSQFHLIEEYRSPDCPLHGSRSQSAAQNAESPQPPRRRESNGQTHRITSRSPPQRSHAPDRAQTSAPVMTSFESVLLPVAGPSKKPHNQVPDLSMSAESSTPSNPSPKTPFDPQTPKAMKLVFDKQSVPVMEMGLKCVEVSNANVAISRPKSAVW